MPLNKEIFFYKGCFWIEQPTKIDIPLIKENSQNKPS